MRTERLDPANPRDAAALTALLQDYASGPAGGGKPLPPSALERLPGTLAACPTYVGLLARDGDTPVGLLNAFTSVSTFAARPLMNIHDLTVATGRRGQGIGRALLAHIERIARAAGCCKLTLEVLDGNRVAVGLYESAGFARYRLDPAMGDARFMQKWLAD